NFSPNKNFVIKKNDHPIYTKDEMVILDDYSYTKSSGGYNIVEIADVDYLVAYKKSRHSDLTYFNILPFDNISEKTRSYKIIMIFVFIFMFFLTISLSYRAAKGISEPLESLTRKIKKAQNGSPSLGEFKHSHDEIENLSKNFQT